MPALTEKQHQILKDVAVRLGVPSEWLWMELYHESARTFSPTIKNPVSSARGIMQWTNMRALDLGYKDSFDLVKNNPTVESQLELVYRDLKRYKPFHSFQELVMAVFLPGYRHAEPSRVLPAQYQAANKGIVRVQDYVQAVVNTTKGGPGGILPGVLAGGSGAVGLALVLTVAFITQNGKGGAS